MVNLKAIFYVIGTLLIVEGAAMVTGLPFSIYYGDNDITVLLICGIGTALTGFILMQASKTEEVKDVKKRDGYLIVSLGWLIMTAFGALPFVIYGSIPSYTDAFFETMAGFTTTGASILNDIESIPHGLLYWRSITQWLGGMGFIVLSIAILPVLGVGGMQLFVAEVPGPTKDKIHPRVQETAKRLWGIYLLLTGAEAVLLMFGGLSLFDAVNHSFTTMATGGFSTKQASIAAFDSAYIHWVFTFFMFAAGVNFTVHYFVLHRKFSVLRKNEEFRFYLKTILTISVIVAGLLMIYSSYDVEKAIRHGFFQVVSMVTTTGYVISDYETYAPFSQLLFFLMMFIGGSAGSTGGSIKIVRLQLLIKNSILELKRLIHPRAVIPVRFNNMSVQPEIIYNILAFFLFYIGLFTVGAVLLSIHGLDFLTSIGASATCLGNVGPGIGSVGPVSNFAHLPDSAKWILSAFMMLGRLELFTVLIIFSKAFWEK